MTLRPYAAAAAAGAVLVTLLASPPAEALPPTTRTVKDASEPDKAYDITQITMRSAPRSNRPAVVLIKHARKVKAGDSIEVWFDFDGDKVPDIHVSGDAFSEFTVYETKSFTKDGKNISKKDVARLSMAGSSSKIRLFPARIGQPVSFAVAVKSSTFEHARQHRRLGAGDREVHQAGAGRPSDLSVSAQPVEGLGQSLAERHRLETGQERVQPGGVGERGAYVAAPLRLVAAARGGARSARPRRGDGQQVAARPEGEVDRQGGGGLLLDGTHQSGDDRVDVGEVAALPPVAVHDQRPPGQGGRARTAAPRRRTCGRGAGPARRR